jgi:hypothetical protein
MTLLDPECFCVERGSTRVSAWGDLGEPAVLDEGDVIVGVEQLMPRRGIRLQDSDRIAGRDPREHSRPIELEERELSGVTYLGTCLAGGQLQPRRGRDRQDGRRRCARIRDRRVLRQVEAGDLEPAQCRWGIGDRMREKRPYLGVAMTGRHARQPGDLLPPGRPRPPHHLADPPIRPARQRRLPRTRRVRMSQERDHGSRRRMQRVLVCRGGAALYPYDKRQRPRFVALPYAVDDALMPAAPPLVDRVGDAVLDVGS